MSEPDLFVVCKNCSAEVSPYVTECPYCGQRVRKRAPKLDMGAPAEPKQRKIRAPKLPKLRGDEIPGIAPDTRPYGTLALIALSLVTVLVVTAKPLWLIDHVGVVFSSTDEPWKYASTLFAYDNFGYAFIALICVGIFGTQLERRFGIFPVLVIFLSAGAAGAAASDAVDVLPALGANGAALALLAAWYVDDRRALKGGDDRESDMLGVYVLVGALLLCSAATREASIVAAVVGGGIGYLAGYALPVFTKRA
ncbi:MAG: rhomboid family intramembrane serine protease [Thermoleophilaceae bacterium]|nr:rhomboid family intramembrane serine protease [Thermoleophilaceae bacterium]